jgi:hypothetical protein
MRIWTARVARPSALRRPGRDVEARAYALTFATIVSGDVPLNSDRLLHMTKSTENLILEHLRAIRGVLGDHGERLNRIELRLSAIEQTLGSLYALSGSDRERLEALTRRVERIEHRLELRDTDQ